MRRSLSLGGQTWGLSREEPDLDPGPSGRDQGLSLEGTDLDPGPLGRDRGNLQKSVFAIKPGDCFRKKPFRSDRVEQLPKMF